MIIKEISLLSEEEVERFWRNIPKVNAEYWLRSEGETEGYITIVNDLVNDCGKYADALPVSCRYVRPTLIVVDADGSLKKNEVEMFGLTWTVLHHRTSKTLLVCNQTIAKRPFGRVYGTWETSSLRCWLQTWIKCMADGLEGVTLNLDASI